MSEESQKLYTPFILRFGFLHSYWRTLPFLALIVLSEVALWVFMGIGPQVIAALPFAIMLILAVMIGVWTIRDIVAGYDDLFDVFDGKTEEKLKLYRSMDRPSSEAQEDVRSLFKDRKAYEAFRSRVRQILFSKSEVIGLLATTICFSIVMAMQIPPAIVDPVVTLYPWTHIRVIIDTFEAFFLTLLITLILLLGVGLFRTISLLGASSGDLRVWNYIQYLRGDTAAKGQFMSYQAFYENTSTIGGYVYRITIRIVLLEVIAALAITLNSLLSVGYVSLIAWFGVVIIVIFSLLIFLSPLLGLHNVMKNAKNAVLKSLEEEYSHLKIKFVSRLREKRRTKRSSRLTERDEELTGDINTLQAIMIETRLQGTWPFKLPMALKIIGASLIPALWALLETFF